MISWGKYIAAFVIVSVLSGLMAGLSVYFKPHKDTRGMKADFVFSAADFAGELSGKDTSYTNKYIGRVVEVSGKIDALTRDSVQSTLVFSMPDCDISGTLDPTSMERAGDLKEGDEVRVKCICTGIEPADELFPGIIQMNRCALLDK